MRPEPLPAQPLRLRFGSCELDPATRECRRGGQPVPVRRLVFDLLLHLIERRPATVTHAELAHAVWRREAVSAAAMARAVLDARRAIGDSDDPPRLIVTVYAVGYRFGGVVEAALGGGAPLPSPARRAAELAAEATHGGPLLDRAAQQLASAAALAVTAGARAEQARALVGQAWLAVAADHLELAADALARADALLAGRDEAGLRAELDLNDGFLHLRLGDLAHAQALLDAAHGPLVALGDLHARCRCEELLAVTAVARDDLPAARRWQAAALDTARAADLQRAARRALLRLLQLDMQRGERLLAAGDLDAAARVWEATLTALCHRPDLTDADGTLGLEAGVLMAGLLGRTGRVQDAWRQLAATERLLQPDETPPATQAGSLWLSATGGPRAGDLGCDWPALQAERAQLLARDGRWQAALLTLQAAVDGRAGRMRDGELPALCALAAQLAERHGQFDLALGWCRRQLAAQQALDRQARERLARVVQRRSAPPATSTSAALAGAPGAPARPQALARWTA